MQILIRVLACTDALWAPFRWRGMESSDAAAAIHERRIRFGTEGIPFVHGGSAARRKAGERQLAELDRLGFVQIHPGQRGERRRVSLTPSGDMHARSLAPTSRIDEAWPALERVAAAAELRGTNKGFALEHDVLGIQDSSDPKPFLDFEDECLPLLANGLLESMSDAAGRIGYRVTDAGHAALADGPPAPPVKIPDYDAQLGKLFVDLYQSELDARDSWTPSKITQVRIPLSAGAWR